MSKFKTDLQELLEHCILYKTQAPIDSDTYTTIEQTIETLETAVKNIKSEEELLPPTKIEVLAAKLNYLLAYDKLTDGKFEKWADSPSSFSSSNKNKELLDKVLAVPKAQIEQFIVLYNALEKSDRKEYKTLVKTLKHYPKMIASIKKWQQNVDTMIELNKQVAELGPEFNNLNLHNGKDNFNLISEDEALQINALLIKFTAFKATAETLPTYFDTAKKGTLNFCNTHIERINFALERTAKRLDDPSIQPPPHEDHNYVLKTIKGDLFKAPKRNSKNEPLIADNDALQGLLGDCYLIAALIGLAQKCPDIIRNAIKEIKKGDKVTYEVTLYFLDPKDKKKLVAKKVSIDNKFMVQSDGSTAYAAKGDQGELWALVIEKAMAKALGGYKALAGGSSDWALRMLSGEFPAANKITQKDTTTTPPKKASSKEDIIKLLKENKGKLMTVSIGMPKKVKGLFDVRTTDDNTTESHYIDFLKYIIYCNHAYVIEAIDYVKLDTAGDKEAVITLQNPHNTEIEVEKYPKVSPLLLKYCAIKIVVL
jgi:hypothetical protein